MSLAAGSRLGPYEITAQIGAGGMGGVYYPAPQDGRGVYDVAGDGKRFLMIKSADNTASKLPPPHSSSCSTSTRS